MPSSSPIRMQFRSVWREITRPVVQMPVTHQAVSQNPVLQKGVFTSSAQVESAVSQGFPQHSGGLKPVSQSKKVTQQPQDVTQSRPAQQRHVSQSKTITVRLRLNELAFAREQAERVGYTLNTYIRAAVLGAEFKPPISREMRLTLIELTRELTAQGRNLNQIARRMNSDLLATDEAIPLLEGLKRPLLGTLQAVRQTLASGQRYSL